MISFDSLENAYLFVNSSPEFSAAAAINKKTGEIFYSSDMSDVDEIPEEADFNEDYVFVPQKNDLDLGHQLIYDFVDEYIPKHGRKVQEIFHHRGAYRNFKNLLNSLGLLDTWHDFENKQTQTVLRQWAKENGVKISD